jgi:hypothetical protein
LIHKSKIEKLHTRISHSTTFRRHSWLTLVVEKDVLPCHLMCHDIFFLSGQCMYSDYVRFGVNSIFFPPFISLFSTSICILSMNKIITTLQFFSLEVFFYIFWISIVLFDKITSNWEKKNHFYPPSISHLSNWISIILIFYWYGLWILFISCDFILILFFFHVCFSFILLLFFL